MPQLSNQNIFVRQNLWVKVIILILGSGATLAIPEKAIFYLIAATLVYLSSSPSIFKHIITGLKAILPFFAAYSIFASILAIPFPEMIALIVRIIILVSLLAYFTVSLSIKRTMEDIQGFKRAKAFNGIVLYCISTMLYLKRLTDYYRSRLQNNRNVKTKQNPVYWLIDAIHVNWLEKDIIQIEAEAFIHDNYFRPAFLTKSNLWGCIYITLLILILSL